MNNNNIIQNLVSIITPCYNTESYIHKLIESVLVQTYPYVEMYVVDDGSTDNSAELIKSYIPKFESRGYRLHYIFQENAGQSAAINNGLQYINGEYLVWPDSDDYYADNTAIEQMVNVLKSSSADFAMVRTQENLIEDTDEIHVLRIMGANANETENTSLFEDCLFESNEFYYCPGAYMIKTEALFASTELPIYQSKNAGQNWQLMLPILFNYRCKTILKPLYNVTQRVASHSRGQYKGYENVMHKYSAYEQTVLSTLEHIKNMPTDKLKKYSELIHLKYVRLYFRIAIAYNEITDAQGFYTTICALSVPTLSERLILFLARKHLFVPLKTIIHFVKNIF